MCGQRATRVGPVPRHGRATRRGRRARPQRVVHGHVVPAGRCRGPDPELPDEVRFCGVHRRLAAVGAEHEPAHVARNEIAADPAGLRDVAVAPQLPRVVVMGLDVIHVRVGGRVRPRQRPARRHEVLVEQLPAHHARERAVPRDGEERSEEEKAEEAKAEEEAALSGELDGANGSRLGQWNSKHSLVAKLHRQRKQDEARDRRARYARGGHAPGWCRAKSVPNNMYCELRHGMYVLERIPEGRMPDSMVKSV